MTAWEELRETCLKCQACQLRQTCTQVVFSRIRSRMYSIWEAVSFRKRDLTTSAG